MFICEACTVRAVLKRELGAEGDKKLLLLERVRILDLANSWASNTYKAYGPKLNFLQQVEGQHPGLEFFPQQPPSSPPANGAIPIAWAELLYSLRRSNRPDRDKVSFGTIRQVRSAACWRYTIATLIRGHGLVYDDKLRSLVYSDTHATQETLLSRFTEGLRRRVGDTPRPSYALLERHVKAALEQCDARYKASHRLADKRHWAQMGLANCLLWLGWLRSHELFDLRWEDVVFIRPEEGPRHDLPPGVGCLLLTLNPLTKTSQARTVDVPIAHATAAGFRPGVWYERLCSHTHEARDSKRPIFVKPNGAAWTSDFFRSTFLYPLLETLQRQGDPYLAPFKSRRGRSSLSLKQAFFSLHCYRRGARTNVELHKSSAKIKASTIQIYEHARWTRRRSGEQIDVLYRQWPLYERLKITLFCM